MNLLIAFAMLFIIIQTVPVYGQTDNQSSTQSQSLEYPPYPKAMPQEELLKIQEALSRDEEKRFPVLRAMREEQKVSYPYPAQESLKHKSRSSNMPSKEKEVQPGNFILTKETEDFINSFNPHETTGALSYTEGLGELKHYAPDASYGAGAPISNEQLDSAKQQYYWKKAKPFIGVGVVALLISIAIALGIKVNKEVRIAKSQEKDNTQNS